ncbi:hypothetical protein F4809DRAFT_642177 [Biscogniauxia mediterranea]|nr:hypothetical protein F4809DRAFT_642177 [Biscogniauxia mediterranea]
MNSNSLEGSQDLKEVRDNSTTYSTARHSLVVNGSNSRIGSSYSTVPIRSQYTNCDCSECANTDPKSVQTRYGYGTGSAIPSTQRNRFAEASGYGYNLGPAFQQSSGQQMRFESSVRPWDSMAYTVGQAVPMTMPMPYGYGYGYGYRYAAPAVISGGYPSPQAPVQAPAQAPSQAPSQAPAQAPAQAPSPKPRPETQELQASMAEVKGDLEETKRLAADVRDELEDILAAVYTRRPHNTPSSSPTTSTTNNATANDTVANETTAARLTEKFSDLLDRHTHVVDELLADMLQRLRTMALAAPKGSAD